jgi:hypothetical protein
VENTLLPYFPVKLSRNFLGHFISLGMAENPLIDLTSQQTYNGHFLTWWGLNRQPSYHMPAVLSIEL